MPLNSPKRPPYWNCISRFDFHHITAVDMSFCTSLQILSKSHHPRQKKITSCRFSRWRISAILDFRGPIMGSLKRPCTTSYRSSIFAFWRQTDKQTDEQMDSIDALSHSRCRERRLNKDLHTRPTIDTKRRAVSLRQLSFLFLREPKCYNWSESRLYIFPGRASPSCGHRWMYSRPYLTRVGNIR